MKKSVVSEVSRVSREIERLRKNLLCQECHRIWKALKKSVVSGVSGVSREIERLEKSVVSGMSQNLESLEKICCVRSVKRI